ncbi:MAG: hypothetical protein GY757_53885, partial [bacterium]|nr:hypothetical protein [bacterium]
LVLQTIWGLLLMKYNNSEDVVYGAVVSGRPPGIEGIENMVGLFINTVPVRVTVDGEQEFLQILRTQHRKTGKANAYEYQSLAEVQTKTSLKGNLFHHIMIFENYPVAEELKQSTKKLGIPFAVTSMENREQSNYFFNIIIQPGKTVKITFAYDVGVYHKEYMEKLRHHFNEIITRVGKTPRLNLRDLQIITEKEKRQILYEFNDTAADYPRDKTIHQLFAEQAKRTPDSIGLVGRKKRTRKTRKGTEYTEGYREKAKEKEQIPQKGATEQTMQRFAAGVEGIHESPSHIQPPAALLSTACHLPPTTSIIQLTYRELNESSDRLAHLLQNKGVGPG